jgi:nucleotide-binding universal stress UspA family protein
MVFASIVVGTDGSDTAHTALRRAIELASGLGAHLQIVSAYEPVSGQRLHWERVEAPADVQWAINPHEDVVALLDHAEATALAGGVRQVQTFARQGDAADAIIDVAEEQRADLIVVGNKGMTGAKRFLLGSVPNKVSHHAPCSVLIVRTT